MAAGNRITQLDGVRGIAIAMVLVHHMLRVRALWMGVDLFFVLSGFLITGILYNEKQKPFGKYIGGFYARRAKRILPPYVIVMLLATIFIDRIWLQYWYMYVGGMNFVAAFHPDQAAPLPLWSLAVEEQFYLLWPLAVFWLDRKHLIRCALAMMAIAPVLRYVCTPLFAREWAIYMLLPFRMDTMAAGALIALLWPELKERLVAVPWLRWRILSAATIAMAVSCICLYLLDIHHLSPVSNRPLANFATYECTLGICGSFFFVALIGFGKRLLTLWPLMFLGQISYTLYLAHIPAVILMPGRPPIVPFAASVLFATAMWYAVEKPILSYKHKQAKVLVQPERVPLPVVD
jgi:peptidoglycan/LPS O-acetylase OafA/YrhL